VLRREILWDDDVAGVLFVAVVVVRVVVAVGLDEDDVCRFLFTMLD
jgi:hypothetical protein